MSALLEQRSSRPLGVARGTKLAVLEAVERTIRGEEAISTLVPGNNPCSSALDFDDVGLGHVSLFHRMIRCSCRLVMMILL